MRNSASNLSGRMWRLWSIFGQASAGTTAIETAIIFPVFFLFLFAIIEAGTLFWTQSALQSAVEAAARCAAINTKVCGTTSAVQDYAASQVPGLVVSSTSFSVTTPGCGHQVSISYPFSSVVPQLIPWAITLNATSCLP